MTISERIEQIKAAMRAGTYQEPAQAETDLEKFLSPFSLDSLFAGLARAEIDQEDAIAAASRIIEGKAK